MKTKIYKKNNMYYKMVNGELIKLTHLERFIKFLNEEMVYQRFRYNRLSAAKFKIPESMRLKNFLFDEFLSGSFVWHETSEGHEFWNDISEKWDEVLRIEGYDNDQSYS